MRSLGTWMYMAGRYKETLRRLDRTDCTSWADSRSISFLECSSVIDCWHWKLVCHQSLRKAIFVRSWSDVRSKWSVIVEFPMWTMRREKSFVSLKSMMIWDWWRGGEQDGLWLQRHFFLSCCLDWQQPHMCWVSEMTTAKLRTATTATTVKLATATATAERTM